MPTPPTGLITCAASPTRSNPGLYHRGQRPDSVGEFRYELGEGSPERLDPFGPELGVGALGDDVTGLPVVEVVEQDRDVTPAKAEYRVLRVFLLTRQAEPEDVHRWRGLDRLEAR